jgi:starvation-inducible DNA-binding protein
MRDGTLDIADMYPTRHDLPRQTRVRIIALCNESLADGVDLESQARQAQWNVKGPHFWCLHTLFGDVTRAVGGYVDLIAERVAQLGGTAAGTARDAAARSRLPEYPHEARTGLAHVDALVVALATFAACVRSAIGVASEAGDAGTSSMFSDISRGVDKCLWQVEAHRQAAE